MTTPSLTTVTFISKLQSIMKSLQRDVLGDFNIDLIESPHHQILTILEEFGFAREVGVPTTDYCTLLDHVYVNSQECVQVEVLDMHFSDHDTVCISLRS